MQTQTNSLIAVKLTIHKWSGSKVRHDVAEEIAANNNADSNSVKAIVRLLPKDVRSAIGSASSQVRRVFYQNTLPWDDDSWRVLRANNYTTLMERVGGTRVIWQRAIDLLMENYDTIRKNARTRLGKLYAESEFPSPDTLRSMFDITTRTKAITDPNDIRITGLSKEDLQEVKKQMEAELQENINGAVTRIIDRLKGLVSDALSRYDKKDQEGTRYKGLQERVSTICSALKNLNITGDAKIDELIASVESSLTKYNPTTLRTSSRVVSKAKAEASDLLDALESFGN